MYLHITHMSVKIDIDSVEIMRDHCGLISVSGIKVSDALGTTLVFKINGRESSSIEFTRPITTDSQTESVSFNSLDVDTGKLDFVVSVVNDGATILEKTANMDVDEVSRDYSESYHGSFRVRFIVACIAGLAALSTTSLPGWKGGLFAIFCSIIAGLLTGMIGDATELF
jgi:hypothetical protein